LIIIGVVDLSGVITENVSFLLKKLKIAGTHWEQNYCSILCPDVFLQSLKKIFYFIESLIIFRIETMMMTLIPLLLKRREVLAVLLESQALKGHENKEIKLLLFINYSKPKPKPDSVLR
jgi:hypothetical protein